MQPFITAKQAEIVELCRTHHVRRFSIFGSAVRDDFDPERSDVDVRIEFKPDALENYVRNFHSLHDALVATFGRKVDIISSKEIQNRYLRKEIEDTQVTLYAA
jgi:predicted nucleotidyltransferase